jgi:hypothetical protein
VPGFFCNTALRHDRSPKAGFSKFSAKDEIGSTNFVSIISLISIRVRFFGTCNALDIGE